MLYLVNEVLFEVNYFAADEGKSLICRVFIEAEMIRFCVYAEFRIRGHPLRTYAKFSEKLTFLTPLIRTEMLVFRKILRTYLMDNP